VAGALVLSAAGQARANTEEDVLIVLGIGVVAMDFVFTGYALGAAAKGEEADRGWLIAETCFTAPQTAVLLGAFPFIITEEREPAASAMFVPTMMISTMTAHGATGLLFSEEPAEHVGISVMIATNTTLSNAVLTRTFQGELSSVSMAAIQVSATVPQLIVGTINAATVEEDRARWAGLTAWAGGLFLHGLASLLFTDDGESDSMRAPPMLEEPPQPEEPLPPISAARGSSQSSSARPHSRANRALSTPRVRLAPTTVSDGVILAPGLGLSGVF
jgi:hypothetical protein